MLSSRLRETMDDGAGQGLRSSARDYRILASFEWIAVVSILTAVWSVGQDYGAGMRISVTWKIDAKTRKEKALVENV